MLLQKHVSGSKYMWTTRETLKGHFILLLVKGDLNVFISGFVKPIDHTISIGNKSHCIG